MQVRTATALLRMALSAREKLRRGAAARRRFRNRRLMGALPSFGPPRFRRRRCCRPDGALRRRGPGRDGLTGHRRGPRRDFRYDSRPRQLAGALGQPAGRRRTGDRCGGRRPARRHRAVGRRRRQAGGVGHRRGRAGGRRAGGALGAGGPRHARRLGRRPPAGLRGGAVERHLPRRAVGPEHARRRDGLAAHHRHRCHGRGRRHRGRRRAGPRRSGGERCGLRHRVR